jgi:endoribonuclease LACTB2
LINIVNVGYDSTNYYVLARTAPVLLLDVGFPGTLPKLLHTTKRAGIDLARVPYLLCTHYHPDHAGAAAELQARGVRLIVLPTQHEAMGQLGTYIKPDQPFVPIREGDALRLTFVDSRAFLRSIGIDGQIISTPGHSPDSVTLLLDGGATFTGDLTPPTMVDDDPLHPVRRAWDAIRAARATTIYPGHGPSVPV